jgi:predicted Zn finger-like uncharacterized protein
MIISCPECTSRFNVADSALGTAGRVVRCAKCGHKWHQMPDGVTTAPASAAPAPRPAPQPAAAARPAVAAKRTMTLPPVGDLPLEMPPSGGGGAAAQSMPSAPEPEGDMAQNFDMPDSGNSFTSTASEMEGIPQPQDDDGPSPFAERDQDPIPEVFSGSRGGQEKKRGNGLLIFLLVILTLLVSIPAGLYFLRAKVVEAYPPATEYYEMLGIDAQGLGAGLKFRNVTSERVVENNVEILVVRGSIANVTEKAQNIPLLKLMLFDAGNAVVQEKTTQPPEKTLPPNESLGFKVQIESPTAAARRFEVTFAPRPEK